MIELILMRAFMVFYVHHYKTAIISAGERTYKTLAQVCYLWWQTLDGWPESDTRLWLKHQIVKRIVGKPVNQVTWGIGLCVSVSVCMSLCLCVRSEPVNQTVGALMLIAPKRVNLRTDGLLRQALFPGTVRT